MERPSIISPRDESFLVRFLTRLNAIKRGKRLYSLNAENKGRGCKFVIFSFFFFFEIIQGIIQRKEGRKEGRKEEAIEKRFNKCANVPFSTNISIPITVFWWRDRLYGEERSFLSLEV